MKTLYEEEAHRQPVGDQQDGVVVTAAREVKVPEEAGHQAVHATIDVGAALPVREA